MPPEAEERRVPVQSDRATGHGAGTIAWDEHVEAWEGYHKRFWGQSAERIAERGGFGYGELLMFLGRVPRTWRPR